MKRKKWVAILTVILVLGGVALVAAKSKDKSDPKAESSPFRLGKVQAEDLQVSVREVGVVDPVTKVEVKSVVPDLQAMLHGIDRKARVAPFLARERNWSPSTVSRLLVLPNDKT